MHSPNLIDIYLALCNNNVLMEEYCNELCSRNTFRVSLFNEIKDENAEEIVSIIDNLLKVSPREHIDMLFNLICGIYDSFCISDNVLRILYKRGLSKEVIKFNFVNIPKNSSNYLVKIFLREIERNQSIVSPIEFSFMIKSSSFLEYLYKYEKVVFNRIIYNWEKNMEMPAYDYLRCIDDMIIYFESEDIKYELSRIMVNWYDKGLIDDFINKLNLHDSFDQRVSRMIFSRGYKFI